MTHAKQFHADVMGVVEILMIGDPAPETTEGKTLVALATAVEKYEKATTELPESQRRTYADGIEAAARIIESRELYSGPLAAKDLDDLKEYFVRKIRYLKDIAPAAPAEGYRVFRDGNMWCAVGNGFINLQESKAGFGHTPLVALGEIIVEEGEGHESYRKRVRRVPSGVYQARANYSC